MSYTEAMAAAGADVELFEQFGSYQGEWYARVSLGGQRGWVSGSYGSCSECDAFDAEFGYGSENCGEHKWDYGPEADSCEACKAERENYTQRLADFGRHYLDGLMTQEEAEKKASRNLEWDSDAAEMLAFLKANAVA